MGNEACTVPTRTVAKSRIGIRKKESIIGVQWFQKNPNPRVHHSVGTVDPQVGICLSPLDTNDGFYLSHTPVTALRKDKKNDRSAARWPHVDTRRHCNVKMMSLCRITAILGFSGSLFHVFQYSGEQEKESII